MQTTAFTTVLRGAPLPRHGTRPSARCSSAATRARVPLRVLCDEEEVIPLLGLPKQGFTEKDLDQLAHPHLLGGKTIGEELALIRRQYVAEEERYKEREAKEMRSEQWDGDVYIGGRWNTLSVLCLVFLLTPLAGLAFAMATRGALWDTGAYF